MSCWLWWKEQVMENGLNIQLKVTGILYAQYSFCLSIFTLNRTCPMLKATYEGCYSSADHLNLSYLSCCNCLFYLLEALGDAVLTRLKIWLLVLLLCAPGAPACSEIFTQTCSQGASLKIEDFWAVTCPQTQTLGRVKWKPVPLATNGSSATGFSGTMVSPRQQTSMRNMAKNPMSHKKSPFWGTSLTSCLRTSLMITMQIVLGQTKSLVSVMLWQIVHKERLFHGIRTWKLNAFSLTAWMEQFPHWICIVSSPGSKTSSKDKKCKVKCNNFFLLSTVTLYLLLYNIF